MNNRHVITSIYTDIAPLVRFNRVLSAIPKIEVPGVNIIYPFTLMTYSRENGLAYRNEEVILSQGVDQTFLANAISASFYFVSYASCAMKPSHFGEVVYNLKTNRCHFIGSNYNISADVVNELGGVNNFCWIYEAVKYYGEAYLKAVIDAMRIIPEDKSSLSGLYCYDEDGHPQINLAVIIFG